MAFALLTAGCFSQHDFDVFLQDTHNLKGVPVEKFRTCSELVPLEKPRANTASGTGILHADAVRTSIAFSETTPASMRSGALYLSLRIGACDGSTRSDEVECLLSGFAVSRETPPEIVSWNPLPPVRFRLVRRPDGKISFVAAETEKVPFIRRYRAGRGAYFVLANLRAVEILNGARLLAAYVDLYQYGGFGVSGLDLKSPCVFRDSFSLRFDRDFTGTGVSEPVGHALLRMVFPLR